jgi:hypothetical protein
MPDLKFSSGSFGQMGANIPVQCAMHAFHDFKPGVRRI